VREGLPTCTGQPIGSDHVAHHASFTSAADVMRAPSARQYRISPARHDVCRHMSATVTSRENSMYSIGLDGSAGAAAVPVPPPPPPAAAAGAVAVAVAAAVAPGAGVGLGLGARVMILRVDSS